MKIIKEGKDGGLWSPQVECTGSGNGNAGCGAILELSGSDLFHTRYSFMGRFAEDYLTFECPLCKEWTDLNEEKFKVPNGIRNKVMEQAPKYQD